MATIKTKLRILTQCDFVEKLLYIVMVCFTKGIEILREKRKYIFEMHTVLSHAYENNYQVEKIGNNNILSVDRDPDLGSFKVIVRRKSSDFAVFSQIFRRREHESLVNKIETDRGKQNVKYIVDAGAYTGLTTIYFKKHFINSAIVAIEPHRDNYNILLENIKINRLENILPINGALWHEDDTDLKMINDLSDRRDWRFYVTPTTSRDADIKGISVHSVMKRHRFPYIDILKLDIEGAERFIFENEERVKSFLPFVRYLTMEIHNEFNIRDRIIDLLKRFNFEHYFDGELTVAYNLKFMKGHEGGLPV